MEQQDYLKKQIDQLGLVLAKLLGDILGLKSQGKETESILLVDKVLKNELGTDISELATIPKDKFIETLKLKGIIGNENLDRLADILLNIANENQDKNAKNKFLERVIEIYKFLEKNDKTYSFDRYLKIEKIKKMKFRYDDIK